MSTTAKNRRGQRRYSVSGTDEARVEFVFPAPHGRTFQLPLTNISSSGLSFRFDENDLVGLEEGAALSDAVVRVGACTIRGELLVMHVTPATDSRQVCGALFYPSTDTDLVKLKSLVTGMEVAGGAG